MAMAMRFRCLDMTALRSFKVGHYSRSRLDPSTPFDLAGASVYPASMTNVVEFLFVGDHFGRVTERGFPSVIPRSVMGASE